MKKFFAVAMTAALVLPTVATSAAAQNETITIEGLTFLDRNNNRKPDAGETPRSGVLMRARNLETREIKWEFTTGADGRYRAVLPKGPKYAVFPEFGDYTGNRTTWDLSESRTDADFAFAGYFLDGFTFVDANGDGEKQDDEKTHEGKVKVTGKSNSGAEVNVETQSGADGAYRFDLPLGQYQVVAPDLRANRLGLAKPKSDEDIDWLTGTRAFPTGNDGNRNYRVDLRYFDPKGDLAVTAPALSPAKDVYVVGDEVEATFQITNKGEAPEAPTFTTGPWSKTTLGHSGNVEPVPGSYDEFAVKSPLLPGQSLDVKIRVRFATTEPEYVNVLVRPSRWGDESFKDNVQIRSLKVVEKGVETTTPPASSTTTAPPATTTTQAVAEAGNSGLASTGASPLGFLALGALLLAAGLSTFFMARRRRS